MQSENDEPSIQKSNETNRPHAQKKLLDLFAPRSLRPSGSPVREQIPFGPETIEVLGNWLVLILGRYSHVCEIERLLEHVRGYLLGKAKGLGHSSTFGSCLPVDSAPARFLFLNLQPPAHLCMLHASVASSQAWQAIRLVLPACKSPES